MLLERVCSCRLVFGRLVLLSLSYSFCVTVYQLDICIPYIFIYVKSFFIFMVFLILGRSYLIVVYWGLCYI